MRASLAIAVVACLGVVATAVAVALASSERGVVPETDPSGAFAPPPSVADEPRESRAVLEARPFVPVAPDQEVKIAFGAEAPSSIARKGTRVRICDGKGEPVPFGLVSIAVGESEAYRTTFRGGAARVPPMSADAWIEVYGCEARDGDAFPWAATASGPIAPGTRDVEIRLPRDEPVVGFARDGATGVAGVSVEATPTDRPAALAWSHGLHASATTDPEGRFVLHGLRRGTYLLAVLPPAPYLLVAPTVATAGSKDVAIALRSGVDVSPVLLDGRGEPVEGAEVRVRLARAKDEEQIETVATALTDESGAAHFTRLDAALRLALHVEPPPGRRDLRPTDVDPWRPSGAKVNLPRGYVVAGRVVDLDGKPVPRPWLTLEGPGLHTCSTGNSDGTFDFTRLSDGRYTVHAVLDGHPNADHPAIAAVTAGDEDVTLALDVGRDLAVRIANWPEHAGSSRRAGIWWTDAAGADIGLTAEVDDEGIARFSGLRDGVRYTLFLPPGWRDDASFIDRDVRVGAVTRVVRLEPGRSIRGRVLLDGPSKAIEVRARVGQELVFGAVAADGSYEIRGMPEGVYRVGARDARLESRSVRCVSADADGTAPDIDLRSR